MKRIFQLLTIVIMIVMLFGLGPLAHPVHADPALPLPRLPICGDQDGSETPFVLHCANFVHTPSISAYRVVSDHPFEINFDFVFREAGYNNELGLFRVDDDSFAINGLHPGDGGYLAAAFARAKIIFSSGSDAFTPDINITFDPGDILVFFIIQDNSVARFLESNPSNDPNNLPLAFFSIDELNPDGVDHFVGFRNSNSSLVQFGFEDLTGGGDLDYDDVVYNMNGAVTPVTGAPPYTTSYYVQTNNLQTMFDLGCQQGQSDLARAGAQNGIVVLMFGRPVLKLGQYGASVYAAGFQSTSQIAAITEQFAAGYYKCTASDNTSHLRIVVGTSNYASDVTYEHGRAWGAMVNEIASWVISQSYSKQVDIAGGSDMELAWNTAAITKKWVDGYASVSTRYMYDFGDSQGCPQSGSSAIVGSCSNSWTQDDIWYISWKSAPAWPLPQNYNTIGSQAKQWQQISLYSSFKPNFPRIMLAGVMTQYQACVQMGCSGTDNTPETGWTLMSTKLNANPVTAQNLTWLTDIKWGPK